LFDDTVADRVQVGAFAGEQFRRGHRTDSGNRAEQPVGLGERCVLCELGITDFPERYFTFRSACEERVELVGLGEQRRHNPPV